ncbi:hypothetical protein DL93DRAFT_2163905 [Clavulina sp. PMI_390]|nr:hypothetical protein DL93DRAFT_2163905 [Clavulina sp. PMI_390]
MSHPVTRTHPLCVLPNAALMAWLYDLSFSLFVLVTAAAIIGSGVSLILPALFSATTSAEPNVNWNVIAIVGSYFAVAVVSLIIYLSRKITTIQKLRSIPRKIVANKHGDVPSAVANLVASEYDRTCAVAYLCQPHGTQQQGWGMPGSEHEGVNFRHAMLQSVITLDATARMLVPALPALRPHQPVEAHFKSFERILTRHDPLCLSRYSSYIQQARYGDDEPMVSDYETCIRLQSHMHRMWITASA